MSDPKEQQREPDELELDAETIKDLEPRQEQEEEVRGGGSGKFSCVLKCGVPS